MCFLIGRHLYHPTAKPLSDKMWIETQTQIFFRPTNVVSAKSLSDKMWMDFGLRNV
jgi:hypothetical protein